MLCYNDNTQRKEAAMTKSVLNLERIKSDMRYRVMYYATVAGGFLIIAVLASLVLLPLSMIDFPEKFTFIEFLFYLYLGLILT